MLCTSKEQETCDVEKRGCEGCYYNKEDLSKKKPLVRFSADIIFYQQEPQPHEWGSESIVYNFHFIDGVILIEEVGAFGDRTLLRRYKHIANKGFTLEEALNLLADFSKMTYEEFESFIYES